MGLETMKIQTKLALILLGVGLLPLLTISTYSNYQAGLALWNKGIAQLQAIREEKKHQLHFLFNEHKRRLIFLAAGIHSLREEAVLHQEAILRLKRDQITIYFKNLKGQIRSVRNDSTVKVALGQFMAGEGMPVGSPAWRAVASQIDSHFVETALDANLEDILLIDPLGRVRYSLLREPDLGQGLLAPESISPALAAAFRQARFLDEFGTLLTDFFPYPASGSPYAAFLIAQLRDDNQYLSGYVAFRLGAQSINAIMQNRTGLGRTGESYLVGMDGSGRTFYRNDRIIKRGSIGEKKSDPYIRAAFEGRSGTELKKGSTGQLELISFAPLPIPGLKWVVLISMEFREALDPQKTSRKEDYFLHYINSHDFYDMILVSPMGLVFHSVKGDTPYLTNLLEGPVRDSPLGRLVQWVLNERRFGFADFHAYEASRGMPSAFVAVPVMGENQKLHMVAVLQMDIKGINKIMHRRDGMGTTGETLLLGPDQLLRSDPFLMPERFSVSKSFADPARFRIHMAAVSKMLEKDQSGVQSTWDYRGEPVLAAFSSLNVLGVNWGVVTKMDRSELVNPIRVIVMENLLFVCVVLLLVILISLRVARQVITPIKQVTHDMRKFVAGNLSEKPLTIINMDEVGELTDAFNHAMRRGRALMQQEMRALAEKTAAVEANKAKSIFLSNMSHEIRTPMNAIIGMSHLTLETELTDKQHDYLKIIQSSAQSLLGIINDILDFSKIEAGKLSLEARPFRLKTVLNNLAPVISLNANEKGLQLLFSFPDDVPNQLMGDPMRLGQILINLANNAVKFTDNGQIFVGCSLEWKETDRVKIQFTVQDSGIGLTEAQTGQLFQPFSQADTSTTRKYGGTGLGLSICKRLVEMMDGEIRVTSKLGVGSLFTFTACFGYEDFPEEKWHSLLGPNLRGMRVLVVGDNTVSRQLLEQLMVSFSFDCQTVDSSSAALIAVEKAASDSEARPFQIVLMDREMSDMDCLEAAQRIKESPVMKNPPPIILVSTFRSEERIPDDKRSFLDGYISKPVTPSELLSTIMTLFGGKERESSRARVQDKSRDVDAIKGILGAKVLLADDDWINQQVVMKLLENKSMVVTVVDNGAEAVAAIRKTAFDIVLMDIQMPEMDGLKATAEIRKDPRFKALPILAMTAHAMAGDRDKSLKAGMSDHITKPIDPKKLYETLIKWVPVKERAVANTGDRPSALGTEEDIPGPLPGIDQEAGLQFAGGNRKLYKQLLRLFRQDYRDVITTMRAALDRGEEKQALRLAHTIGGILGSLGASKLQLLVRHFETALKEGNSKAYGSFLDRFEVMLIPVLQGIATLEEMPADVTGDLPQKSTAPVDVKALRPLFLELVPLLENGLSSSKGKLREIIDIFGGIEQAEALKRMQRQIKNYDFEEAQKSLFELARSLEIPLDEENG